MIAVEAMLRLGSDVHRTPLSCSTVQRSVQRNGSSRVARFTNPNFIVVLVVKCLDALQRVRIAGSAGITHFRGLLVVVPG